MNKLLAGLVCVTLCAGEPLRMSTRGRWIVDEHNRVVIFHGFNDVGHAKGGGYLPGATRIESNLAEMEKGGFNGFRMPMMWAGVNPAEGIYNDTHLAVMEDIVNAMGAHNMHSFLDMHQDVLSSLFKSYDGAPQWVVNQTVPRHAYPWPIKHLKGWAEGYVTEAVGQSFQDIYDNKHGGRDAWAAFWKKVAEKFNGNKNILAYELINEPWAGDVYEDPLYFLPEEAGRKNLLPSYDHIVAEIKKVDTDTIIMFEPVTWGMVVPAEKGVNVTKILSPGFDHVPGGDQYRSKSIFSWHYYCWMLNSDYSNSSQGYPPMLRAECDDAMSPLVFSTVIDDMEKIGSSSFLTEFGALTPSASNPKAEGSMEIASILKHADETLQSWTYWDIASIVNSSLHLIEDRYTPFIRPFAQATAGTPQKMKYDPEAASKKFEFEFLADVTITEPTVIAVPEQVYPSGVEVVLSPAGVTSADCPTGVNLLCVSLPASLPAGTLVSVVLKAK